jgi:CelD/BcsL family acetyltransferase involved in cellulose biosynthesis
VTTIRPVRLPLYLLQYRVWTLTFRAFDRNADWLGGEARTAADLVAPADVPDDCQIAVVRSQPLAGDIPVVSSDGGWIRYLRARYPRRYIDMKGTFKDYLATFSSKSRSTLTRKVRKFGEASGGALDVRVYSTPEQIAEFHRLAREVSKKTYQEKFYAAGLPDGAEYVKELRARAARDAVRGFLLFQGGNAVAYLLCPVEEGRLLYDHLGHDPAVQQLSPGTVLQYAALEKLYEEGRFRIYDFTEGDAPHKEFFATDHRECGDVWFLRRTLRNRIAVSLHRGLDRFSARIRKLLERIGIKAWLKRLTRRAKKPKSEGVGPGEGDAAKA